MITKKEYLWIDGLDSFHYEPTTYLIVCFLFGIIPVWIWFKEEWLNG